MGKKTNPRSLQGARCGRPRKDGDRYPNGRLKPSGPAARTLEIRKSLGLEKMNQKMIPLDVAHARGWLSDADFLTGIRFASLHQAAGFARRGGSAGANHEVETPTEVSLSVTLHAKSFFSSLPVPSVCGVGWTEGERLRALASLRWHQTRSFICCGERQIPLEAYEALTKSGAEDPVAALWDWWASDRWAVYRAKCRCCGAWPVPNTHASFQGGKLYSPWSRKDAPHRIAKKWLDAQGDEGKLQAWWNTQMGRPYRRHAGKEVAAEVLAARRENWLEGYVPDGVALLTAGVDTQDDRIEIEVVGWGLDQESWSVEYHVIPGAMDDPATKARLDQFLLKEWKRADGRTFRIAAVCHDSGVHHTEAVYQFSKERIGRQVWAIKGASDRSGNRSPVWPSKVPSRKGQAKFRPFIIGTQAAKDVIHARLQLALPGPGYMHFPADRDFHWFSQLTAERIKVKVEGGRKYRVWEQIPGRANEALDCRVYAFAALSGWLAMGGKLNALVAQIANLPAPEADALPLAEVPRERVRPAKNRRRVSPSSYMR